MQVNNCNPYSKTVFTGGIDHSVYSKLVPNNNKCPVDIFNKIDDITAINQNKFVIIDAIYNAKEKVGEFFLSAVQTVKFIHGLENVKPRVVKAKGENLADAFKNISSADLKDANNKLASDYNRRFQETIPLREEIERRQQEVQKRLDAKYNEADGFWVKYYDNLNKSKN